MAKRPNSERDNRHCFVAAKTGGGKSQLMRNELIPKAGIRALFWDVDTDHKCTRYSNRGAFLAALKSADRSGKPFRIGWSGDDDPATFEWFCRAAWAVLDGERETWVICEEMADLGMGQKMPDFFRKLMVRGRKYGAIVITTTQRCQEVPKALITQPANRYIGLHEDQDSRYLERATGIRSADIETLKPLTFWHKGPDGTSKISTKYRKFTA
ncbi:MAG: hypothetical protein R3303_11660 [Marinobacter sp.]|nr:hypothetical protein [Marinobacter sp.]